MTTITTTAGALCELPRLKETISLVKTNTWVAFNTGKRPPQNKPNFNLFHQEVSIKINF